MPGTTPVYGFPYPEPTDLVADYPALGQDLAEDIEAVLPTIGGLMPATPTSIANSGGTATLSGNTVTFTGVSSVSLNGCFTGDYDNYRVLVHAASDDTSGTPLQIRVRASGSDLTTASYYRGTIVAGSALALTKDVTTGQTGLYMGWAMNGHGGIAADIIGPYKSGWHTFLTTLGVSVGASADRMGLQAGRVDNTNQYDGFTLYNLTGLTGTVSVYGYKK